MNAADYARLLYANRARARRREGRCDIDRSVPDDTAWAAIRDAPHALRRPASTTTPISGAV
jgi:hypothetical protein